MICPQCGAAITADATTCEYCRSPVSREEVTKREHKYAKVKASAEFANASSPERLARLPKIGAIQKTLVVVFFAFFIGASAFMGLAMLGAAGLIGGVGLGFGGGSGAAFSLIPLLFAIVPLGFVVVGVLLFLNMRKRMSDAESGPVATVPVVVLDKRTHVWGGSGDSSAKTSYYATCESEDGTRNEYQLWDGKLYGRMTAGDAGVLFTRSKYALDFDRVV